MHFNVLLVSDDSDTSNLEDMTATVICSNNETSTRRQNMTHLLNLEMWLPAPLKGLAMYQILNLILMQSFNVTTL